GLKFQIAQYPFMAAFHFLGVVWDRLRSISDENRGLSAS
ncbi:hypothetical protein A2U01_0006130, partial [Trifolium medium]|nr:hypothetical protein [Trifolium medium]